MSISSLNNIKNILINDNSIAPSAATSAINSIRLSSFAQIIEDHKQRREDDLNRNNLDLLPPQSSPIFEKNLINWIKDDNYLILGTEEEKQYFHNCNGDIRTRDQIVDFIKNHRIIRMTISSSKWLSAFQSAQVTQCKCILKGRADYLIVPHYLKPDIYAIREL